jgi:hypothetical protein
VRAEAANRGARATARWFLRLSFESFKGVLEKVATQFPADSRLFRPILWKKMWIAFGNFAIARFFLYLPISSEFC